MDILIQLGIFVASIVLLLWSSDRFVDAAEKIGLSFGISPFIIGVTIVAFGTSLPELATSIAAVLGGESEIVVGNVVGSNITNIALVLGLSAALMKGLDLENNLWYTDIPFFWGSAFLLWFFIADGDLSILEAVIFIAGIALFLSYSLEDDGNPKPDDAPKASWKDYLFLLLGAALVSVAATFVISSISNISAALDIAPKLIALSAVALGTSLPEVAVSLNAAKKGKASIAVGNAIGSNIFNTFFVMAIPRFFGPLSIPDDILTVYLPLMVAMTLLVGVMSNNRQFSRMEGMLLMLFYIWYFGQIVSSAL